MVLEFNPQPSTYNPQPITNNQQPTMTKKLFTQMRNEWRSNIWLAVELLIISLILWVVSMGLYEQLTIYLRPKGFDTEHCYKLSIGMVNTKSPEAKIYKHYDERADDIEELAERLRHYDGVEAVSLSDCAYPYNGSNNWQFFRIDTMNVSCVDRRVTPDFVRVFRYEGVNGESPEELAEKVKAGGIFVSESFLSAYGKDITKYVGREMIDTKDSSWRPKIAGVFKTVRYNDFDGGHASQSILRLSPYRADTSDELCIRLKPEADHNFVERFINDKEKRFRVGGMYITNIESFKDLRSQHQQSFYNQLRSATTIAVFLLLNIFLGLFGTFWFRTQQRQMEIALHKALGATNGDIFRRLISEGLLLLLLVVPVMAAIGLTLYHYDLFTTDYSSYVECGWTLAISGIMSVIAIALTIVAAIWFPARKAMSIDPAEALHDE